MKWIVLLSMLSYTHLTVVFSKDLGELLLSRKTSSCADISQTLAELFIERIEYNKVDSAKAILNYWRDKCNTSEPIMRAQTLISLMETNMLDLSMYDDLMWRLSGYINRKELVSNNRTMYYDEGAYFGFVSPGSDFDVVIDEKFSELSKKYDRNSLEYLFSNFYSGNTDSLFYDLQKADFKDTKPASIYMAEVDRVRNMGEGHIAWITGVWIPTGEMTTFGLHPELGFLIGWKKGAWNYDIIIAFKFLKSENEYLARRKQTNTIETTDEFFGGQIGIDIGKDVFVRKNYEIQLIGGLAMDGIDVLEGDEYLGLKAQSIFSYNFNFGFGYRIYTNGHFYFGIRAKYNIIDYTVNNVIGLTGNAFTLQLLAGSVTNKYKSDLQKRLGQKSRQ